MLNISKEAKKRKKLSLALRPFDLRRQETLGHKEEGLTLPGMWRRGWVLIVEYVTEKKLKEWP